MRTMTLRSGSSRLEVSALCLGIMHLGVTRNESDSFAILDHYYEAGGRFLDTANNYGSWGDDPATDGGSELVLGRWLARRGVAGDVVVATKCGAGKLDPARPLANTAPTNFEGLAPDIVRTQLHRSLDRLGLDRVGVYYGHVDDRTRPAAEIADTFATLAEEGLITIPAMSNMTTWRLAEARRHSQDAGRPEFGVWQQQHSVYWPAPGADTSQIIDQDAIDYSATNPQLTITTYSPQQAGQLVRPWLPFREQYDHPGSDDRLRLTHQIAHDLGVTANQVAIAWHLAGPASNLGLAPGTATADPKQLPARRASMLPIVGASSIAQLDESIAALDLHLDAEQLHALDAA